MKEILLYKNGPAETGFANRIENCRDASNFYISLQGGDIFAN